MWKDFSKSVEDFQENLENVEKIEEFRGKFWQNFMQVLKKWKLPCLLSQDIIHCTLFE